MEEIKKTLTLKTKLGYGIGSIAASIMGDFMTGYLLYFLTTAAGLAPALAGTVTLVGTICNAIANPIIGIYADKPSKKGSRKHRLFIRSVFCFGVIALLLFNVIHTNSNIIKGCYYIVLCGLFYFAYATYEVPFYAIAAGLTDDADERTSLSSVQVMTSYAGSFIIGIFVPIMIDKFAYSEKYGNFGWLIIIAMLVMISGLAIFICWLATKHTGDAPVENCEEENPEDKLTVKKVFEMLKNKSVLFVMLSAFFYYIYYNIYGAVGYYFLSLNLGWSGAKIASYNSIYIALGITFTYLAGRFAVKFDKKKVFIVALTIGSVTFIGARFVGIHTVAQVLTWYFLDTIQMGVFWCLIYTFLYDAIDIDEFHTGVRKEGTIMGIFTLIAVLGQALAGQIAGIFLQFANFDESAATQSKYTLDMIYTLCTFIPGIFLTLCTLMIVLYPVTKKKFELFQENFEKKQKGEEYSTEGFEDIF